MDIRILSRVFLRAKQKKEKGKRKTEKRKKGKRKKKGKKRRKCNIINANAS